MVWEQAKTLLGCQTVERGSGFQPDFLTVVVIGINR